LHWAGRGGAQDLQACRVVGVGVVHERFLTVQFEDGGSEKGALRVSQALIQINDNSHSGTLLLLFRSPNKPGDLSRQREITLKEISSNDHSLNHVNATRSASLVRMISQHAIDHV
jgi:hypothetical protein